MQILFVLLYFFLGIIQIFSVIEGIQHFFNVWTFVAALGAIIISYIPFIGGIAGILGAKYGWGWEWWQAIVLFMWQPIIYMCFMGIFNIAAIVQNLFGQKKDIENSYIDVEALSDKSEENVKSPLTDVQEHKNIFMRMFHGELSLPVTYWVFGVFCGFIWNFIFNFTLGLFEERRQIAVDFIQSYGITGYKILFSFMFALCLCYYAMVYIGQWRCAERYTGKKIWPVLVKITICLGCIAQIVGVIALLNLLSV